ncbi:MAG: FAD-dependent oxidoreductase [Oscillospiraceae bacterium]|jgi:NAD(P)H-nitrite reductase large subunit/rubredoxin|nr:FAD-dependent oxidoreductase [Oscillospiraceae bacterium]
MQKKVRCLICGAVFDADLTTCPVCGVGPEHFVPVEDKPMAFRRDTDERFLILGGGGAALSAAEAIRERNATATIVMLTDEATPPYHRPLLTKEFGAPYARLAVHPDSWYQQNHILALTDRQVQALEPAAREVVLEGGFRMKYDRCIYALGASSFIPPMAGTDLPEVCVLRALRDADQIAALIAAGKKSAVVIGGGVLGLEAAWALREKGCAVTVLERGERLMPRQLDEETSQMLLNAAAKAGVQVRCNASSEAIVGDGGHVAGVRLVGGETLPADLVLISSGVRANIGVAQAAGLATGRGVRVNARMETSQVGVYACGDCAETDPPSAQLWPAAAEMGRIAGANAAGDNLTYEPASAAVTFHGMGTALYSDGAIGAGDRVVREKDEAKQTLQTCYYEGEKLRGVILFGDISRAGDFQRQMQEI